MLDFGQFVLSPDFEQPCDFIVRRMIGQFNEVGVFEQVVSEILMEGTVLPHDATRTTVQIPEGDRIKGAIDLWTTEPLYTAGLNPNNDGTGNLPDEVVWNGDLYKVVDFKDLSQFGFYKSTAVRIPGIYSSPSVQAFEVLSQDFGNPNNSQYIPLS